MAADDRCKCRENVTYGPSVPPSEQKMNSAALMDDLRAMQVERRQEAATARYGMAQQVRAPGKMFSRSEILAIIRGHLALSHAQPAEMKQADALGALIIVFENIE